MLGKHSIQIILKSLIKDNSVKCDEFNQNKKTLNLKIYNSILKWKVNIDWFQLKSVVKLEHELDTLEIQDNKISNPWN